MALEARSRVKVGKREYFPRERLTAEHEAEIRSRAAFSLLIEEGALVEVDEAPETAGGTDPLDPPAAPELTPNEAPEPPKEEVLTCPHCDYTSDKKVNLRAHIRRNHPETKAKRKPTTRKR